MANLFVAAYSVPITSHHMCLLPLLTQGCTKHAQENGACKAHKPSDDANNNEPQQEVQPSIITHEIPNPKTTMAAVTQQRTSAMPDTAGFSIPKPPAGYAGGGAAKRESSNGNVGNNRNDHHLEAALGLASFQQQQPQQEETQQEIQKVSVQSGVRGEEVFDN